MRVPRVVAVSRPVDDLGHDAKRFTATSPLSILESLPFLLREERAKGADLVFEIRLTGEGGGVWSVQIRDGACHVEPGFAARADVRYTAEARTWCLVALGLLDPREALTSGQFSKEGGREAMDHYFHQIAHRSKAERRPEGAKAPDPRRGARSSRSRGGAR